MFYFSSFILSSRSPTVSPLLYLYFVSVNGVLHNFFLHINVKNSTHMTPNSHVDLCNINRNLGNVSNFTELL